MSRAISLDASWTEERSIRFTPWVLPVVCGARVVFVVALLFMPTHSTTGDFPRLYQQLRRQAPNDAEHYLKRMGDTNKPQVLRLPLRQAQGPLRMTVSTSYQSVKVPSSLRAMGRYAR